MKCPVCNVNEVVPEKNGTIPDCYQCTSASMDAAWVEASNDNYWEDYPYDEGLDLEEDD